MAAHHNDSLDLPPGFRAIGLRELKDAFETAVRLAPEEGAGTLVWTRRFDLVEVAVVLEPEAPLAAARRAFFASMNAAGDALAAACPPEKPITFAWPGTILLDGALVGGGRLAWPENIAEHEEPAWLVFGLMLRLMTHSAARAPGFHAPAHTSSLEAEGVEILDARTLIGSFARHLMVQVDRWQESGFDPIGKDYLARLSAEKLTRRGIDGNGDLLIHRVGAAAGTPAERRPLVPGLRASDWLDPETMEPLL